MKNNLQVEELRSLARLIIDLQLERSAVSLAIFLDARFKFYALTILLVFTCSGVGYFRINYYEQRDICCGCCYQTVIVNVQAVVQEQMFCKLFLS